ncbi:PRC-barrel domain-containing protein [Candidatus Saccharibacteria bacterium]|nr:PRC-barrel domain-containing protein [Candidatus Saccharibacteria bacterium]
MLLATNDLLNTPVMSLQTGAEIAVAGSPVIDPSNFHILAYELYGDKLDIEPAFLKVEDIRELSDIGFIVDSSDEVIALDDIVVGKESYLQPIQLEGMRVIDDHHNKIGKVERVIMTTETFEVEQLYIRQPFLKSFSDTELIIHRRQIIDVTKEAIVVRSPTVKEVEKNAKQAFINPFHQASPQQPESVKSDRH